MNITQETYNAAEKYLSDIISVLMFQTIKKFNDNKKYSNKLVIVGGKAVEYMFENPKKSFDWDIHIINKKNHNNKKKLDTFEIALLLESIVNTFMNKHPQYVEYLNNSIRSFNVWTEKKYGIVEEISKDILIYFNNSLFKAIRRISSSGASVTSIVLQLIYNQEQFNLTIVDLVYDNALPIATIHIDKSATYNINNVIFGSFPLVLIGLYDMATRENYKKSSKNYDRLIDIYDSLNNVTINCDYQFYLRRLGYKNIIDSFSQYKIMLEKSFGNKVKRDKKMEIKCDGIITKIMEYLNIHELSQSPNSTNNFKNMQSKCYGNIVLVSIPDPGRIFERFNVFPYSELLHASQNYLNMYDRDKIIYNYTENSSELNSPLILYGLTKNNIFLHKLWWRSGMSVGDTRDKINDMISNYHNHINNITKKYDNGKFYVYKCSRYFNKASGNFLEGIRAGDKIYQHSLNSTSYKMSMDKYVNFIDIGLPFFVYKINMDMKSDNYIIIDKYATPRYNDEGEILLKSDIVFNITGISKKYILYKDKYGKRFNLVYLLEVEISKPTIGDKYINDKFIELADGNMDIEDQCDELDNMFGTIGFLDMKAKDSKGNSLSNKNDGNHNKHSGVSAGGYYNKYVKYKKKYLALKNSK